MAHRFITRSCAIRSFLVSFVVVGLAACGSGSDAKAPSYEIQATVTGLLGNVVVLQLNGRGDTTVSKDSSVTLTWAPTGFQYDVTVATSPTSPAEICTVSNGKGTVGQAAVKDVLVACSEQAFKVTASVTGLIKGSHLPLCDRANDLTCENRVSVTQDGVVTVTPILADAGLYALQVFSQPVDPPQACTMSNWFGAIHATDATVSVVCTTLRITGKVTGSQVAGVQVSLTGELTATATTDSGGNYVFDKVANGSYTITPTLPTTSGWTGWVVAPTSVSVVVNGADAVATPFRLIAPGCVAAWCAGGPNDAIGGGNTVWGTGPDAVWVTGGAGTINHWDGAHWSQENSGTTNTVLKVFGNLGEVYAVDTAGNILHRTGASWTTLGNGGTISITKAAPIGPSDVWALSYGSDTGYAVLHWDGKSWTTSLNVSTDYEVFKPTIRDLWADDSSDVWVVGQDMTDGHGIFLHWNGISWKPRKTDGIFEPYTVGGSGPSNVWAAGYQSNAVRWDGSALSSPAIGRSLLFGLWSDGPTNVWGVGYRGLTVHWDGQTWTYPDTGVIANLGGVWGDGPNDIWAVGDMILRWQQ